MRATSFAPTAARPTAGVASTAAPAMLPSSGLVCEMARVVRGESLLLNRDHPDFKDVFGDPTFGFGNLQYRDPNPMAGNRVVGFISQLSRSPFYLLETGSKPLDEGLHDVDVCPIR